MTRIKALQLVLRSSDEALADLITALTAERDTLAAQVVQMREALEEQYAAIDEGFLTGSSIDAWECNECGEFGDKCRHLNHTDECNQGKILKVLALTPTASLSDYRDEVLEGVAKHVDAESAKALQFWEIHNESNEFELARQYYFLGNQLRVLAAEIRAMKGGGK